MQSRQCLQWVMNQKTFLAAVLSRVPGVRRYVSARYHTSALFCTTKCVDTSKRNGTRPHDAKHLHSLSTTKCVDSSKNRRYMSYLLHFCFLFLRHTCALLACCMFARSETLGIRPEVTYDLRVSPVHGRELHCIKIGLVGIQDVL